MSWLQASFYIGADDAGRGYVPATKENTMAGIRREVRQTAAFRAKGSDGRTYHVLEFTEYNVMTALDGLHKESIEGLKEYRLNTGGAVNRESDNDYVVVSSGIRLMRI